MRTALVIITDGRQPPTIVDTIETAQIKLRGEFDAQFIIDDSGSDAYAQWLDQNYATFDIVHHESRRGLAGALRSAWETSLNAGADYTFSLEDDFTFPRKVKVDKLAALLHCEPHLAQISLKRQPVNDVEEAAGGFIQTNPSAYFERTCETTSWIEHRVNYTFNPHLVSHSVTELALSNPGDGLERGITDTLLTHGYSFGIYGTVADEPRVIHTGKHRSSGWTV